MKFKDFKYERPSYEIVKEEFLKIISEINESDTYDIQSKKINKLNELRNDIQSMSTIASIKYSINTEDTFFKEEREYWDEYLPYYDELNSYFYKSIVNSKFKEEVINEYGMQFYKIASYSLKSFSSEIINELQEENKLCSEYTRLLASAKIPFNGEEKNLSGIQTYMISNDRNVRIKSSEAFYKFFEENEEKFDDLFDKLVKIRDSIAKKLKFNNFVELGYIRMMRTEYDANMVEVFRQQVLDYIVPVASKLYKKQEQRLGIDKLTYVDESIEFLSGNAKPKGNDEYIIDCGRKMYAELSKDTKEFFEFMLENELMDLVNKSNKGAGGYCAYIPKYKSPFIFSNFNQTADDIDVLTHEAGHAFQLYMSRNIEMPEINFPTLDSCEIHSMSMEFITYPWMELFFKEDSDKYKFAHMSNAIKFIPYGIVVDEFQHVIYENPELSKDERKKVWRQIESKYLPHKDYENNEFLERGCWWFKQGHIFKNPFYYIDYTLAQICALQFFEKTMNDNANAWNDYLNICKVGGTKSFLEIINIGNLKSPFEKNSVEDVINFIGNWFDKIDDKKI